MRIPFRGMSWKDEIAMLVAAIWEVNFVAADWRAPGEAFWLCPFLRRAFPQAANGWRKSADEDQLSVV
jgi:hypothetical protein